MVHYNTTASDSHQSTKVCTNCHVHSFDTVNDGRAFEGSCSTCHGGGTTGDQSNYWPDSGNLTTDNAGSPDDEGEHTQHMRELAAFVLRLVPEVRTHPDDVRDLLLRSPSGAHVRLRKVARVFEDEASGLITRENVKRKAVISCNVAEGHNLGDLVAQIRSRVTPISSRTPRRVPTIFP